jgi:GntR family transcriptional regulator
VILRVDPATPVPPYEQIRTQISTMAATGTLRPGTRLPAIRQLAADLGLAGGTVARAYRELESDGVIVTRGRHGTFVVDRPPRVPEASRNRQLAEAAHTFAVAARHLGADAKAALEHARRALDAVSEG